MKKLFLFLVFPLALQAQLIVSLTGPANVNPGDTGDVFQLSVQGTTNTNLSGLQFSINLPPGAAIVNPTLTGLYANPSGFQKGIFCSTNTCLIIGDVAGVLTNTPISADGVVANLPISFPANSPVGPWNFTLSALNAVNTTNTIIPLATTATSFSSSINSKCDLNGDGKVDGNDLMLVITTLLTANLTTPTTCTVSSGCTLLTAMKIILAAIPNGVCTL